MFRENMISLIQRITMHNLILLLNLETLVNPLFNKYSLTASYNIGSILETKDTAVNEILKNPHSCVAYILLARGRQETKTNN